MGSRKEIRDALEEFLKQPEEGEVTGILERYLSRVAVTGITLYPWSKLKPLITRKMNLVVEEFVKECPMESLASNKNVENTSVEDMKKRLNDSIELFNGIPFTIQRLCELLTDQNISKQYRRVDKFMRGIEKNLNVVTTVDPFGNRIVGDPKSASNGVLSAEDDCLLAPTACTTVKTPPSWFSSLSSVVNSPDSYPNWKQSQDEQQEQQDGAISSSQERKKPRSEDEEEDKDCLPPPSKLFRPGDEFVDDVKQPETKDGSDSSAATNSTFTPLLTQLLNGSTPISSSEKEQSVVGSCDSTESSQPSGLLEILTGKLKDTEMNLEAPEGTPSVDAGTACVTSQVVESEVFSLVRSEAAQSTQYHVEITEQANNNKKDVPTTSDEKTNDKTREEPEEVKRTQEGELESSGVKCQQPSDDPDSLFSF